jgi:hypothetical protein
MGTVMQEANQEEVHPGVEGRTAPVVVEEQEELVNLVHKQVMVVPV